MWKAIREFIESWTWLDWVMICIGLPFLIALALIGGYFG